MEVRVGDIVDLVTRTREGHVTGQVISNPGHERSHAIDDVDPSSGDGYREIRNPPQTLG